MHRIGLRSTEPRRAETSGSQISTSPLFAKFAVFRMLLPSLLKIGTAKENQHFKKHDIPKSRNTKNPNNPQILKS